MSSPYDVTRFSSTHLGTSERDVIPLAALKPGDKAVVVAIVGGPGLIRRLADLGLTPGTEVEMSRRGVLRGPIEVYVRGVRLALGFGVASKVLVKPL
ncbi:MAG: ferrous iron transport protein A [Candidatus Methanomethylicota archaeon]|uniref:Ferrous iron transport protein A n=1 Tax=Thermoproteota archaeon TaxID=2056631 RepID=A0A497EW04_9CREN|nr:MAG: ferrous iron transport protein A [Candidatus Verstraetearchaeota archaeon]RLE51161.1 MAG: ferrous iron transport protein A [Candidatus Verstraetearchaeota archaeon]